MRQLVIDDIKVGNRHRKEMGDLKALADSIAKNGLLQPIGVTRKKELVFGERRLRAIRDILGEGTIIARIVDVPSILDGEYAENEIRKDFTPSERVEIAKAIVQRLGNRQGQRTDSLVEQIPEVEPGKTTREIAAKKAGFGNDKTYRQAATVVEKGTPELIQAMDDGKVSISAGSILVDATPEEQKAIVALDEPSIRQATKEIGRRKGHHEQPGHGLTNDWLTPPHILDALGTFDLDPCASLHQPTKTAIHQFTIVDNGLKQEWDGRVWLNPPYGGEAGNWLKKMATHLNGIVLVFARTDSKFFTDYVWPAANGIFFLEGRLKFGRPDNSSSGGATSPSVLISYDASGSHFNQDVLRTCSLKGKFLEIK